LVAGGQVGAHEREAEQRPHRGFEEDIERDHPNVCSASTQRWGDIGAAFAGAALVVEGDFRYPLSYEHVIVGHAENYDLDAALIAVRSHLER